jgi:hypothetical protein
MRKRARIAVTVVALVLASAVLARAAYAETAVLPQSADLPWTDPAHASPLEQLATQVAQQIAGRPVSVRCEGENDWDTLAVQDGFDPSVELGSVPFSYFVSDRTIADGGDVAYLSPGVCWNLEQFGLATVKPTECQPIAPLGVSLQDARRFGEDSDLGPAGPTPCFAGGVAVDPSQSGAYWQTYEASVQALWVLAHESIHLLQDQVGASIDAILPMSETDANCYGLQWLPAVAEQFGATPDDAQSIADYAFANLYPAQQGLSANGSSYWSADCREDGPLDLTPGDGIWP